MAEENPHAARSSAVRKQPPILTWPERVVVVVIGVIFVLSILPNLEQPRTPARRTQCRNNLRQIGLALHNYADKYGSFPPAYTVDSSGKPLHSWRTLLLPFLENENLYNKIDLSKSWEAPENADLWPSTVGVFRCPAADIPENHTTYLAVTVEGSAFAQPQGVTFMDFKDATSNTILIVEVDTGRAVPWMAPIDADESILFGRSEKNAYHTGGYQVLFADGSARFVASDADEDELKNRFTFAGGEELGGL